METRAGSASECLVLLCHCRFHPHGGDGGVRALTQCIQYRFTLNMLSSDRMVRLSQTLEQQNKPKLLPLAQRAEVSGEIRFLQVYCSHCGQQLQRDAFPIEASDELSLSCLVHPTDHVEGEPGVVPNHETRKAAIFSRGPTALKVPPRRCPVQRRKSTNLVFPAFRLRTRRGRKALQCDAKGASSQVAAKRRRTGQVEQDTTSVHVRVL